MSDNIKYYLKLVLKSFVLALTIVGLGLAHFYFVTVGSKEIDITHNLLGNNNSLKVILVPIHSPKVFFKVKA